MTAEGWERPQAAIPELLCVDFDDGAEPIQVSQFVRFRDGGTGRDIVFYENDGGVEARVMTPPDPVAVPQLMSVRHAGSRQSEVEVARKTPAYALPQPSRSSSTR
ncbi:hypothetical protein PXH69_33885 [Rhodococcus qingshengii]|uniref:Uncharacterized protein n=1 Tax=Rhodococcus qingshengii TaxID=334542 RepID=A0AAW6M072_RHOSG|nr:hypothetical protein [Rhodococcus qingshengii]MDE8649958.1 hypothetical protein [Rhodococcus qingshengii]